LTRIDELLSQALKGVAASPGIAIGKAHHVQRTRTEVVYQEIIGPGQVVRQLHRLEVAVTGAEEEIKVVKARVERELPAHLYLIEAHLMILRDEMFYHQAKHLIEEQMINAEWAVVSAVKAVADKFALIEDPYLKGRIQDVEAVAERVLRLLAGQNQDDLERIRERAILIARDLSPVDTTQIDLDRVMGFVNEVGGRTSHTAIIAQSLEIPAVVGLENALERIPSGSLIIVDGNAGEVLVSPDEATLREYHIRQERYQEYTFEVERTGHLPARTVDGHQIVVLANIEQPEEGASALAHGAEGIGLFRTEFPYLSQERLPTEEELYESYRQLVEIMDGRPATIRTLDLGGDKFAHTLDLATEMNPAMGLRAVRFCLRRPDIFKTQLRAILRASALGRVRVMFPMISGISEIVSCRRILSECQDEIRAQGRPFDPQIEVGCMIEIPSAVFICDLLARHVDFFSIGTNDLIQYSLAIDRVNEYVAHMYQPFHPALLRMVKSVIETAAREGIPLAMCGEMAAEPGAVPLLLGMGLSEFSVNPLSAPKVKQLARLVSLDDCRRLAAQALTFETTSEVRDFINRELNQRFPQTFAPDGRMLY